MYACYSSGPVLNKDEPKESFPLKVTGDGPDIQTWIGDDGRTYTMEFGKPIFKITNINKTTELTGK
jgi:hypothetical protein